jgi:hypothetical protein
MLQHPTDAVDANIAPERSSSPDVLAYIKGNRRYEQLDSTNSEKLSSIGAASSVSPTLPRKKTFSAETYEADGLDSYYFSPTVQSMRDQVSQAASQSETQLVGQVEDTEPPVPAVSIHAFSNFRNSQYIQRNYHSNSFAPFGSQPFEFAPSEIDSELLKMRSMK